MAGNQVQCETSPAVITNRIKSKVDVPRAKVRRIGIAEYKGAALCLAEAFESDEVARYFLDTDDLTAYDEQYKWKLHCDILNYVVSAHCLKGIVTTVGDDYEGVALW